MQEVSKVDVSDELAKMSTNKAVEILVGMPARDAAYLLEDVPEPARGHIVHELFDKHFYFSRIWAWRRWWLLFTKAPSRVIKKSNC